MPVAELLERLVEREEEERALREMNAGFENLREDEAGWAEFKAETAQWDMTSGDDGKPR